MSLLDLFRSRGDRGTLTLYTGPGCTLCETVKAELLKMGAHRRFDLQEVDITTDRELKKRYGLSIPVLALNGEHLLSGKIDPEELRRALQTAHS